MTGTDQKKKRLINICFVLLLIFQITGIIYLGHEKKEYHIDEIYSYILSNSYETDRIANDPSVWNHWISGKDLNKFTEVRQGEQFAYDRVYYNNTKDAHPPLYYDFLHTVCSFFPDSFSKWYGIGLNIILFGLTQLFLFRLSKSLFGTSYWSILPAAVYGGASVGLDTVIYIRMYMCMTMWTVLSVLIHYEMLESKKEMVYFLPAGIVTFAGIFTHYYFAVYAFFMALLVSVYHAAKRKWKAFFLYGMVMLAAVAMVFVVYPAGISQIMGSSTNNVGKEVSAGLLDFSGWQYALSEFMTRTYRGFTKSLFYSKKISLGLLCAAFAAGLYKRSGKEERNNGSWQFAVLVFLSAVLSFVTIAHVTGKFVYLRYVYQLMPLFILCAVYAVYQILSALPLAHQNIAAGLVVLWMFGTVNICRGNLNTYLYQTQADEAEAVCRLCENKPVIVLNNGKMYHPTANYTILKECDEIYMTSMENFPGADAVLQDRNRENGVVFIVLTDQDWSNGLNGEEVMQKVTGNSELLHSFKEWGASPFSAVYLLE